MLKYTDLLWIIPLNVVLGFVTCFLLTCISTYLSDNDDDDGEK